ncbi:ABC transporter permease subunit [Paenibacillus sp. UMB4589-SE434]|uniref:ABC transporter permease subunit n=1 Tax=Paenibacillus sp. UMB4589-SE434 TaxID=3046314 RepID=UPI00254CF6FE|nr:ABC transporter permease subunit [Paenibacillus sp. UMB4589-SE434]MDK8181378.1 ABC transporter permease subunit [Paenibacillus sp. UMB4589-SE434]
MNMYCYELKAYRKFNLIWTAALVALVAFMLSMFPTFNHDAEQFKTLLRSMPEAVLHAVGIQIESITSLLGFYSYAFMYVTLCGAIQAMNLGVSIISKESREKTADFLLTKPVARSSIMTAKLLAACTSLILTNLVYIIAASGLALLVSAESFDLHLLLLVSVTLLFVQLLFLSLGVLTAVLMPKIRAVLPISLGAVFAFFLIGILGASTGDDKLRMLTPFKYFDAAYIVQHHGYEVVYMWAALVVVVTSIMVSYIVYMKRDVHTV